MKYAALVLCGFLGALLIMVTEEFPDWGDPTSPASTHLSPHFIEKTMEETSVPNIVSAVLGDYRSYDTMFETVVVFCAGIGCFFILGSFARAGRDIVQFRHLDTGVYVRCRAGCTNLELSNDFERIDSMLVPHDFINSTVSRLLIPFIQLFGLYVIAHGHHSPGGGFQGGVILGAGFILLAVSHNMHTLTTRVGHKALGILTGMGVIIYAGYGLLSLFYGAEFLNYSALAGLLNVDPVYARSLGILFIEIGVGLTVMASMVIIYNNISSMGSYEEGL